MGVCASTHTVEYVLECEARAERDRRMSALARALEANDGRLFLSGTLARANAPNRNNRVYPRAILEREVASHAVAKVNKGLAYGTLEHPDASDAKGVDEFRAASDATRASHRVVACAWRGDVLEGVVEVLDTEDGAVVRGIYERGGAVGASTRAWSSLETRADGRTYAEDDMELICFDLVRDPATYSLFSPSLLMPVESRFEG